jgi:Ni,Fe-hydrogenase III component G
MTTLEELKQKLKEVEKERNAAKRNSARIRVKRHRILKAIKYIEKHQLDLLD